MFFKFWFEGILIGMLVAAPLGPVAIMVIQRTLNHGRRRGFYSGVGITLSDTLYATFTGFGMALLIGFIRQHEMLVTMAGSVVLFILGVLIFFSHPERQTIKKAKRNLPPFAYLASSFVVAVSNPSIVFLHVAIFSGFGVVLTIDKPYEAFFVLSGFIFGGIAWWFLLTWTINRFRKRFSLKLLLWFNRIAGAAIVLAVIAYSFRYWFNQ